MKDRVFEFRCDIGQWLQHETTQVGPFVRNSELVRGNAEAVIEYNIYVNFSLAPAAAMDPPHAGFDILQSRKKLLRLE